MDTSQARVLQINFLKKSESIIPSSASLVYELSDLLEISTDSAYRRLRGETALSIFEVIKLCKQFKVSFDSINNTELGVVTFGYPKIGNSEDSFKEFLLYHLKMLELINKAENKYIKYASEDIPVFYNYKYPEISAFKMFYWMKSIMNVPTLEQKKFSLSVISDEFKEIGRKIAACYNTIPSIEIWTETTILSTIKQIDYYLESGQFESREDAKAVCNSLRKEIEGIQKQAEIESKIIIEDDNVNKPEKNYTLYFSDIEITNNCVFVSMGDVKNVFLGHQTFNTIDTSNISYCADTENWIDSIIKKSTLISGVSEKLRYQFFNKMYIAIDGLLVKN